MKNQIIVGNIGTVYEGPDHHEAETTFILYCQLSRNDHGRAAGEPVTWMKDGEIYREQGGNYEARN